MIFSPVSVGTPQGSPVSPLLFVIYVAPLHILLDRGLVLSYVDDFSLTVSSPSYRTNSRFLQAAFGRIRAIAHSSKVDFSVPKAELIHRRTPLQRDPPGTLRPPTGGTGRPNISPLRKTPVARLLVCSEPCLFHSLFPATGTIASCLFLSSSPFRCRPRRLPPPMPLSRLLLNISYPFIWC